MTIRNETLRNYANLLHENGFSIYEPGGTWDFFTYSRPVVIDRDRSGAPLYPHQWIEEDARKECSECGYTTERGDIDADNECCPGGTPETVECFGTVQLGYFGGFSHSMPIKPSREHGSSMWVAGVPDSTPDQYDRGTMNDGDPLTVEAARKVASYRNSNPLVGTQRNYRDARSIDRYTKWPDAGQTDGA